jgi:putative sterol carrier protein
VLSDGENGQQSFQKESQQQMTKLEPVFEAMPERFQASKAAGESFTVQFNLTGEGGGQWHAAIDDGKLDVGQGISESPAATLTMDANDFLQMSDGNLNPMMAFMSGKIKVDGDLNTVLKFQNLVGL